MWSYAREQEHHVAEAKLSVLYTVVFSLFNPEARDPVKERGKLNALSGDTQGLHMIVCVVHAGSPATLTRVIVFVGFKTPNSSDCLQHFESLPAGLFVGASFVRFYHGWMKA